MRRSAEKCDEEGVSSYHSKAKEVIRSPKKVYPIDLGLHEALSLAQALERGRKLEAFVFLELRRRGMEIFSGLESKFEVDFVIRNGASVGQLIQVCHSISDPTTRSRELNGLALGAKKYRCRDLTLITFDETGIISHEGLTIQAVPAWRWALGA